ncbi:MAG TPA: hypothetical protein VK887_04780, partial [Pseudonocardiaceae bacterium]|nr:hypothetical protein [Pseudonocardiaceae bacterium]
MITYEPCRIRTRSSSLSAVATGWAEHERGWSAALHCDLHRGAHRVRGHKIVDAFAPLGVPVILSGGLRPGNVADAVEAVRPYTVDVNSGVENEHGDKDID